MNTRRFRRIPIDLSTLVTAKGHVPKVCRMRDFCQGGMLLVFAHKVDVLANEETFKSKDVVDIRFTVEVSGVKQRFHIQAEIARVFDDSFGVSFLKQEADVVGLLAKLVGAPDINELEGIPETHHDRKAESVKPDEKSSVKLKSEETIQAKCSLRADEDVVKAKRVLNECRHLTEETLLSSMDEMLAKVADDAMTFSDSAANNQIGQQVFEFLSHLKSHKPKVKARFQKAVMAMFDYLEGRPIDPELAPTLNQYRNRPQNLELIGQDDFNDWVALTSMIGRAENTHIDPLYEIIQRFTELTGIRVDKDNNPIGPSVLSNAFVFSTDDIESSEVVKSVVYNSFENHFIDKVGPFYRALNELFVHHDVLPRIDYTAPVEPSQLPRPVYEEPDDEALIRPSEKETLKHQAENLSYAGQPEPSFAQTAMPSTSTSTWNNAGAVVQQTDSAIEDQMMQHGLSMPQGLPINPLMNHPHINPDGVVNPPTDALSNEEFKHKAQETLNHQVPYYPEQSATTHNSEQTNQASASVAQPQQATPKGKNLFSIARNLLNLSSWGKTKVVDSGHGEPEEGVIDSGTFIEAILKLQDEERVSGQEKGHLSDRVYQAVSRETGEDNVISKVGSREQEVVHVVDTLLDNIRDDRTLTDNTKDWIAKLEVPFLKAALIDPTVFSGTKNPITDMVNLLEKSGSVLDDHHPGSQRVKHSINELLDKLMKEFDWDLETFTRISAQLSTLMKPHLEANDRMLDRVVETCQGQQKLVDAKEGVNHVLQDLLGGKRVPKVLLLLIRNIWRHLLQQTYLREGDESDSWKNNLKIVEYLLRPTYSTEGEDSAKRNKFVLKKIASEMDVGSSNPVESEKILNALTVFLRSGGKKSDWIHVPKKWTVSEIEKLPLTQEETLQACPNDIPEDKWHAWVDDVCDLKVNDWMMFLDGDHASKPVKLAWVGKKFRQFVFVNRMGKKIVDHTLPKLALLLGKGKLIHLDDYDQPLLDRASEAMLQKLHKKIAVQANTDALTRLLNRRGFGIRLRQLIRVCHKDNVQHVLCQLDIDQFKLINDALNFQAGDKYLQEFAKLIRLKGGAGAIPARLGNDTFGLILENCSIENGRKLLERVRWVLQKFRFPVNESHISLTLSIGMTVITSDKDDPTTLLKEADAACASAKSAGGNKLVLFEPGDEEMSKNYRLAYVLGNLVDALEKNDFELVYQEMAPIHEEELDKPMFEVFLQVKDQPEKTAEYISAAQRYHRIPELDRWVVTHLVSWMRKHPRSFAEIETVCVQLSASSLNDPEFMVFLADLFKDKEMPNAKICFQLVETAAISDLSLAKRNLNKIKSTGCLIMLDDFGAGASSFVNLKKLPVDYIKISPAFIKDIDESADDYALVRSINDVGRFLGKKTIASSVETESIRDVLQDMGIDYVQGSFIAESNVVNPKRPPILLSDLALV